jgi:hypothetical protein
LAARVRRDKDGVIVDGEWVAAEPGDLPRGKADASILIHFYVRQALNAELDRHVSCLLMDGDNDVELSFRPRNLWGLICMGLAADLASECRVRQCPGCGKWNTMTAGLDRAHKRLCSNMCKQRVHRRRRKAALALHAEGRPVAEIAEVVSPEVETIKGWVRDSKKKEK